MDLAAVVLAAGAGTRLRPLTHFLPKALCPVGTRPLVDGAVERLRAVSGAVAVNVHHGWTLLAAHLAALPVHISLEERPLGAAGALGRLRPWIAGRAVLVTNADTWPPGDLGELVDDWNGEHVRLLCSRWERAGISGRCATSGPRCCPGMWYQDCPTSLPACVCVSGTSEGSSN
jgi:MurNAc alpha-1-phosphate uridylyltransferase